MVSNYYWYEFLWTLFGLIAVVLLINVKLIPKPEPKREEVVGDLKIMLRLAITIPALALWIIVFKESPMLLDLPAAISKKYETETGVVQSVQMVQTKRERLEYFDFNGKKLTFNRGNFNRRTIEPLGTYEISYLKHSGIVTEYTPISTPYIYDGVW